jgi:hypothetical protein
MTKVNLDGVEAWKGGGILPAGTHAVEITEATEKTSRNNHPQVELEFRAIGGDYDGGTIRDWVTVIPEAFGRIRQLLEAVHYAIPAGEFEMPSNELVGKQCVIVVRDELYNGETKSKVKAYQALRGDVPATVGAPASNGHDEDLPF